MKIAPHGTRFEQGKVHPVLDLPYWEKLFPLQSKRTSIWIDGPGDIAYVEQARRTLPPHGPLGPHVPVDMFMWYEGTDIEPSPVSQIGGKPWREADQPWPCDSKGTPLTFLGQISFLDSQDVLPFSLPGAVALIFGTNRGGWIDIEEGGALEWSPLHLRKPVFAEVPWTGRLPYCYQGAIHRSVQYTSHEIFSATLNAAGFDEYDHIAAVQATQVGLFASLPQGWPFEPDDGHDLVGVLSSFYFRDRWPLCDMPGGIVRVYDGRESNALSTPYDFGVGDAGAIWIYRDADGRFDIEMTCG